MYRSLLLTGPVLIMSAVGQVRAASQFQEMGPYAPLAEGLASKPGREKELEFVKACSSRLNQRIDCSASTEELTADFDRKFSDDKVAPETKLCLATVIVHRRMRMSLTDIDRVKKLISGFKPENENTMALCLITRAKLAQNNAFSGEPASKLYNWFSDSLKNQLEESWLRSNPEMEKLIYEQYLKSDTLRGGCMEKERRACSQKFFGMIEALPVEKQSTAMRSALGQFYIDEAWAERGASYAAELSDAQSAGFAINLKKAGTILRDAHRKDPTDVNTLKALMTISMADSDATGANADEWMQRALAVAPNDYEIYTRYASANKLRWGGSAKNILACCKELLRSKNYDTYKPGAAHDVMESLLMDLEDEALTNVARAFAKEFIPVANEYIRQFNAGKKPLLNVQGYPIDFRGMAIATLADANLIGESDKILRYTRPGFPDSETASAARYRSVKNGESIPLIMASCEANDFDLLEEGQRTLRSKPFLGNLPEQEAERLDDDRRDLEKHADATWLADYGKRLAAMASKVKSDPAKRFMDDRIKLNRIEQDFVAGKKCTIPFSPNLWGGVGWVGGFQEDKAVAENATSPSAAPIATFNGYFKPPYEISLRINSAKYVRWPHVGISVGRCIYGTTGRSFVLESDTGRTYSMPPHTSIPKAIFRTEIRKVDRIATLRVRVFDHGYAVQLNDYPWTTRNDATFVPYLISIGALPHFWCPGRFEYSDMTIRKIPVAEYSSEEKSWMLTSTKTTGVEAEKSKSSTKASK